MIAAAVCVSCHPVYRWAAAAYIYPYRPTFLVLRDLRDGEGQPPPANIPSTYITDFGHGWVSEDVDLSRVALGELLRRESLGRLSPADRRQVDQLALANLRTPVLTPGYYYLGQDLGDRWAAGKLPRDEVAQLFASALQVWLDTDRNVWQWDEVPVRLRCRCDLPTNGHIRWALDARYASVRIDGAPATVPPPSPSYYADPSWAFELGTSRSYGDRVLAATSIRYWTLGRHRIDVDLRIDVRVGVDINGHGGTTVHSETVSLHADFAETEPPLLAKCWRFYLDPKGEAGHYLTAERLDAFSKRGPPIVAHLARVELMRRGGLFHCRPTRTAA